MSLFFKFFNLSDMKLISVRRQRDLGERRLDSRASSMCFRCSHVGALSVVTLSSGEMNQWLQACCENNKPVRVPVHG